MTQKRLSLTRLIPPMFKPTLQLFFQFLKRDLLSFRREYLTKAVDMCFFFVTNVIVVSYFMPYQGVPQDFGVFFLVGAIASFGLIEVVGKVSGLMADLEGEQTISHTLIMPVKSSFVFCYIALFWALTSALLSILLFPLGKLLLFTRFDLSVISYWRLAIMFVVTSLFFGFFSLWLTSVIDNMGSINRLWLRFIGPIWFFGAYFFSWEAAYSLNPFVGYAILINPMVYVMEGMRAAVLGQEGYLPYWLSLVMLWVFIVGCGYHATRRLKKRLDHV